MSIPKVSVIIPLYNTEDYIGDTLRSIINQSLKDIEIIVINDGSTDNSLDIVDSFDDNRLKVISQSNSGQSAARNNGLNSATGKYIYFMDSDDLLAVDSLEQCYNRCEHDNLDFVCFNADIFGDDNTIFSDDNYQRTIADNKTYDGLEITQELINKNEFKVSVCINLIKKDYLDSINLRFIEGIIHEDELFTTLLYLEAKRVGFIRESFFKRRIRPNSTMTSKISFRNINCYFVVAKELKTFSEKQNKATRDITDKLISRMLNAVMYKARKLPLGDKIRTLNLAANYLKYIQFKQLVALIIK